MCVSVNLCKTHWNFRTLSIRWCLMKRYDCCCCCDCAWNRQCVCVCIILKCRCVSHQIHTLSLNVAARSHKNRNHLIQSSSRTRIPSYFKSYLFHANTCSFVGHKFSALAHWQSHILSNEKQDKVEHMFRTVWFRDWELEACSVLWLLSAHIVS